MEIRRTLATPSISEIVILDCRDNGKPVIGSESQQGYLWFEGTYSTAMEAADVVQFVFSEEFVNEECHISAWCWLWIDGEEGLHFFSLQLWAWKMSRRLFWIWPTTFRR